MCGGRGCAAVITSLAIFFILIRSGIPSTYWTKFENKIHHILDHFDVGDPKHDYVIIGIGTVGSIVASRLSTCGSIDVALVDSGSDNHKEKDDEFVTRLYHNANVDTSKQTTVDYVSSESIGGPLTYRTAKILGGASELDGFLHGRASEEDHNKIFKQTEGDEKWSYANSIKYYQKIEKLTGDGDPKNIHGTDGYIEINRFQLTGKLKKIGEYFSQSNNLSYKDDMNNGDSSEGFGTIPRNIAINKSLSPEEPIRQSPWRNLLKPILDQRSSKAALTIYSQCTVSKLGYELDTSTDKWAAKEIDMICNGKLKKLIVKKAVILSSGTMSIPIILNRSGFGDCLHLNAIGIKCHVDLPGIGNNLRDNFGSTMFWQQLSPIKEAIPVGVMGIMYKKSLHSNYNNSNDQIFMWSATNVQLANRDPYFYARVFAIGFADTGKDQSGYIKLRDSDLGTKLDLRFNALQSVTDIDKVFDGILQARSAMASFGNDFVEKSPGGNIIPQEFTRDDILQWISTPGVYNPTYQAVGTTKMGSIQDKHSVVDSNLKLHHSSNTYIIGQSIQERTCKTYCSQSMSMYLGEIGSDIIKENEHLTC